MELKCYITVIPCVLVVRLIYSPSALGPAALGLRVYISGKPLMPMVCPWASGVYIRQTTHAHGITIKYVPMQNHYLRIKYWQFY